MRAKQIQREDQNKQEQAVHVYDKFPKDVADALREGRKVEPRSREYCTIFSSQISGFDELAVTLPPVKVADLLHRLYSKFDDLCSAHDIYKVETITDAYMVRLRCVDKQITDHKVELTTCVFCSLSRLFLV